MADFKVQPNIRRSSLALATVVISLAVVWIMSANANRILVGDPAVYRMRIGAILDGGLPYRDVPVEHLPMMLLPMLAAWFLGGGGSQSTFIVVFALIMAMSLAATGALVDRVSRIVGSTGSAVRWFLLLLPLLPLVVFRNDPFSVLLGVAGLWLLLRERRHWWVAALLGAWAKIWPAALALLAWPKRRASSLIVFLGGAAAVLFTFLPSFTTAREAGDIHAETVVGAWTGLWRGLRGQPVGVTLTTAAYLDVSTWQVVLNSLIGLGLAGLGAYVVLRTPDLARRIVVTGTVVGGMMLVSPLFSLQYVLWLVPFAALSRQVSVRATTLVLGVITTAIGWIWSEPLLEDPAFYGLVTIRNVILIALCVLFTREPGRLTS